MELRIDMLWLRIDMAHEQRHFDITCVLAGKADDALFAGTSLATVRVALRNKLAATQRQYDNQTNHGCNPGPQATWTTNNRWWTACDHHPMRARWN